MDITLTVATRKLASSETPKGWSSEVSPIALGLFLLPLLGLRYSRRSAGKLTRLISYSALLLLSLGAIGTMTGCGSGYSDHTYPITVTATSNGIQHLQMSTTTLISRLSKYCYLKKYDAHNDLHYV